MKQFEYCRCYYIEKEYNSASHDETRFCEIATGKSNKMKIEYCIPSDQILFHDFEEYKKKWKYEDRENKMITKLYFSDDEELGFRCKKS